MFNSSSFQESVHAVRHSRGSGRTTGPAVVRAVESLARARATFGHTTQNFDAGSSYAVCHCRRTCAVMPEHSPRALASHSVVELCSSMDAPAELAAGIGRGGISSGCGGWRGIKPPHSSAYRGRNTRRPSDLAPRSTTLKRSCLPRCGNCEIRILLRQCSCRIHGSTSTAAFEMAWVGT